MIHPTISFHHLLTLNTQNRVSLYFSKHDGWQYADSTAAKFDQQDPYVVRITHYVNWSLLNQKSTAYYQPLFLPQEPDKVYARKISIDKRTNSMLHVTIEPITSYVDGIFGDGLGNSLLDSISEAVIITEAEPFSHPGPRILFANAAFTEMTGYTNHEVLGLSPRILQCEDTDPKDRAAIRRGLQKWKHVKKQLLNERKDGDRFIVELSISPVKDETGWWTHWISVQRDISQQNEVDKLIQRSRLAIEKVGLGTWSIDLTRNELVWDKQMYELYEIDPLNFSGDREAFQRTLYPDDLDSCMKAFDDAVQGVKNFDFEFRILTAANGIKHIHAKADVIRDNKGIALSVIGVNWEITDRKLREFELVKQQQLVIHKSKLAEIGEIAAGVGHEVNNPLAVIMGNVEKLAQLNAERFKDEDMTDRLDRIMLSSERISNIVTGLRLYARSDEKIEEFCLAETVKESTLLLRDIYSMDGIRLKVSEKFENTYYVEGNRGKIQQVIMNLMSNAKDALMQGVKDPVIHMNIDKDDSSIHLSVQDNGIGIPKADEGKVFESFFTTKADGTGIGLSISESIVAEHEGKLTFESIEHQGTTFVITLPLAKEAVLQKIIALDPAANEVSGIRVMLVDDNKEILDLLTEVLIDYGFEVDPYTSSKEALQAYASSSDLIDLVISDMQMPEMDGVSFLLEIQKYTPHHKPKFIIITGGVTLDRNNIQQEHPGLIDGLIYKPFRSKDVFSAIKLVLR